MKKTAPLYALAFGALLTAGPVLADEDRAALASQKMQELFGSADRPFAKTDPEFAAYRDNLIYGDIYQKIALTDEQKELVTLVVLTTTGAFEEVGRHVEAALNCKVEPYRIKEAVYQCAPYVGFPKAEQTLAVVNRIFEERGLDAVQPSLATVTEENRFEAGKKLQVDTYGERMSVLHNQTPEDSFYVRVYLLSSFCFGDTQTRTGFTMKERELLTFAIISALGGAEAQLKSHAQAALETGNTKQELIAAVALSMPYLGFPRTLNTMTIVEQTAAAFEEGK